MILAYAILTGNSNIRVDVRGHAISQPLICLPVAKKQATEYQGSLKEELERLTVHGLLHLHGYDHELDKTEAKKMFRLQEKILNSLPD